MLIQGPTVCRRVNRFVCVVARNIGTPFVQHHLDAVCDIPKRARNKSHLRVQPAKPVLRILKCAPCQRKTTDSVLVHSVLIVQFLNAINADGHRHHFVVLVKKVPGFRAKPELSVRRKGYSGKWRQRNFAPPAFRKPIITDFFNQGRFQQGFTADEIKDNRPCVLIDKIGIIFFIQVQQVIHDFLSGFQRHFFGRLVVLIAVRAPQVASARHLKRDVSAERMVCRYIPACV